MLSYELTPLAEENLKKIARYTLKEWAEKKSIRYTCLLEDHFQGTADKTVASQTIFAQFGEIYDNTITHSRVPNFNL